MDLGGNKTWIQLITLTANNKDEIEAPVSWDETSTALFQKIIKNWDMDKPLEERDRIKLFSIITDREYAAIKDSESYELEAILHAVCAFVYYDDIPTGIPKTLKIKDKTIEIPKDLSGMTIGQGIQIRQRMDRVKDIRELISFACAMYLQPFYDGQKVNDRFVKAQFDMDRVRELEEVILQMPITETYGLGFFFLKKLNNAGMTPTRNSQRPMLSTRKGGLRRWLQRWLKWTGFNLTSIYLSLTYTGRNSVLIQTSYITSLLVR